jgi:hypothetical protein
MPRTLRAHALFATLTMTCFATASASADEPPAPPPPAAPAAPFGARGHIALDDLLGYRVVSQTAVSPTFVPGTGGTGLFSYETGTTLNGALSTGDGHYTTIAFTPSVDYFVADGFSFGGTLGISYQRERMPTGYVNGASSTTYEESGYGLLVARRGGYVARITDDIAFWPKVGLGYATSKATSSDDPGMRTVQETLSADVDLGIVTRLGRHAYLNVGPTLAYAATQTLGAPSTSVLSGGAHGRFGLVF